MSEKHTRPERLCFLEPAVHDESTGGVGGSEVEAGSHRRQEGTQVKSEEQSERITDGEEISAEQMELSKMSRR